MLTYLPTRKSLKGKVGMEGGKGGCSNKPYLRGATNCIISFISECLWRQECAKTYSFR